MQAQAQEVMEEGMEEAQTSYSHIEKLEGPGIVAADIKKLKEGGVNTVECLAHSTKKELCLIKGVSEAKVVKMPFYKK